MRYGCLILVLLVGILLGAQPSEAQYSANYQTNTISGVTSNLAGSYLVGSNTFADALLIQNSGVLFSGNGYLGYEVSGSNNSAIVTDSGSIWNYDSASLYIGFSGSRNSLVIGNGGVSVNGLGGGGFVGFNSNSRSNTVLITGPGSTWTNGDSLYVGYSGTGNSLVISNGGQVACLNPDFGPSVGSSYIGWDHGSSNNSVLVTSDNTNTLWNCGDLYVGYGGSSNLLLIAGGSVIGSNISLFISFSDPSSLLKKSHIIETGWMLWC